MAWSSRTLAHAEIRRLITLSNTQQSEPAHLKRVLGRWDLVLLFVVAIVNLNVVPAVSASGGMTVWLWLISLLLFFCPQGMAVVELSHRYPGEGGIYLWTKKVFGDFHGFLSGWCYWTNNIFYVPTVVLIFLGIAVFAAGPKAVGLANNPLFTFLSALTLLVLLAILNVIGLGVGKWVNNIGGIGTAIASLVLIGLGITVTRQFGMNLTLHDMRIPFDLSLLSVFGVVCFALIGLELASVMGDEIQEPRKNVPFAVALGRPHLGLPLCWLHHRASNCRATNRNLGITGRTSSREQHVRQGRTSLADFALCLRLGNLHRRDSFCLALRFSSDSVRRWT